MWIMLLVVGLIGLGIITISATLRLLFIELRCRDEALYKLGRNVTHFAAPEISDEEREELWSASELLK